MSRVTPIQDNLRYPRDASFWRNPSSSGVRRWHKPSKVNYGMAACSSRILLATEWGTPADTATASGLMCNRAGCKEGN